MSETITATPLLSFAWKFVGAVALICILGLGAGFALPGTWTAERSLVIDTDAATVYPWIEAPLAWRSWTMWGLVDPVASGPDVGVGATLTWDDPFAGAGTFVVTEAVSPSTLSYRVEVQDGSMVTEGRFAIETDGNGTRVTWIEQGDFGWNPLLSYAALSMGRVQGAELSRSLIRLKHLAEGLPIPDSLRLESVNRPPGASAR